MHTMRFTVTIDLSGAESFSWSELLAATLETHNDPLRAVAAASSLAYMLAHEMDRSSVPDNNRFRGVVLTLSCYDEEGADVTPMRVIELSTLATLYEMELLHHYDADYFISEGMYFSWCHLSLRGDDRRIGVQHTLIAPDGEAHSVHSGTGIHELARCVINACLDRYIGGRG